MREWRDTSAGERVEWFHLDAAFAGVEAPLRDRVSRLAKLQHVKFTRILSLEPSRKGAGPILVSSHIPGTRLSEVLDMAAHGLVTVEPATAVQITREVIGALVILHDSRNVTHGALAPERLVLTTSGRVIVVEHALSAALDRLSLPRHQLWRDWRVATPPTAGAMRFDVRTDLAQLGLLALAAVLGRPIDEEEYPHRLRGLLPLAQDRLARSPLAAIATDLVGWLERLVPVESRRAFATVKEAQQAFEGFVSARAASMIIAPARVKGLMSAVAAISATQAPAPATAPAAAAVPLVVDPLTVSAPSTLAMPPADTSDDSGIDIEALLRLEAELEGGGAGTAAASSSAAVSKPTPAPVASDPPAPVVDTPAAAVDAPAGDQDVTVTDAIDTAASTDDVLPEGLVALEQERVDLERQFAELVAAVAPVERGSVRLIPETPDTVEAPLVDPLVRWSSMPAADLPETPETSEQEADVAALAGDDSAPAAEATPFAFEPLVVAVPEEPAPAAALDGVPTDWWREALPWRDESAAVVAEESITEGTIAASVTPTELEDAPLVAEPTLPDVLHEAEAIAALTPEVDAVASPEAESEHASAGEPAFTVDASLATEGADASFETVADAAVPDDAIASDAFVAATAAAPFTADEDPLAFAASPPPEFEIEPAVVESLPVVLEETAPAFAEYAAVVEPVDPVQVVEAVESVVIDEVGPASEAAAEETFGESIVAAEAVVEPFASSQGDVAVHIDEPATVDAFVAEPEPAAAVLATDVEAVQVMSPLDEMASWQPVPTSVADEPPMAVAVDTFSPADALIDEPAAADDVHEPAARMSLFGPFVDLRLRDEAPEAPAEDEAMPTSTFAPSFGFLPAEGEAMTPGASLLARTDDAMPAPDASWRDLFSGKVSADARIAHADVAVPDISSHETVEHAATPESVPSDIAARHVLVDEPVSAVEFAAPDIVEVRRITEVAPEIVESEVVARLDADVVEESSTPEVLAADLTPDALPEVLPEVVIVDGGQDGDAFDTLTPEQPSEMPGPAEPPSDASAETHASADADSDTDADDDAAAVVETAATAKKKRRRSRRRKSAPVAPPPAVVVLPVAPPVPVVEAPAAAAPVAPVLPHVAVAPTVHVEPVIAARVAHDAAEAQDETPIGARRSLLDREVPSWTPPADLGPLPTRVVASSPVPLAPPSAPPMVAAQDEWGTGAFPAAVVASGEAALPAAVAAPAPVVAAPRPARPVPVAPIAPVELARGDESIKPVGMPDLEELGLGGSRVAFTSMADAIGPSTTQTRHAEPRHAPAVVVSESRSGWNWRRLIAASVLIALFQGAAFAAWWWVQPGAHGTLVVQTAQPGVEVLIDGKVLGKTPFKEQVAPGRHKLLLRQGLKVREMPVEISLGVVTTQSIDWPAPDGTARGNLQVSSTPAGAEILIDGKSRGTAPQLLENLPAGNVEMTLRGDAGTVTVTATVIAGETTPFEVPIFAGWVLVDAPIELSIVLRGARIGASTDGQILLSPGRHQLEAVNEALGFRRTFGVLIEPGEVRRVAITVPPATLQVHDEPGSEVFVDGERVGSLPGALRVPLGTHDVLVRRPDQSERRQTVTVRAGDTVSM